MRYAYTQPVEKEQANKLMNVLSEQGFEVEKIQRRFRFQTKDALIDFEEWDDYFHVVVEFNINLDSVLRYAFKIDVN